MSDCCARDEVDKIVAEAVPSVSPDEDHVLRLAIVVCIDYYDDPTLNLAGALVDAGTSLEALSRAGYNCDEVLGRVSGKELKRRIDSFTKKVRDIHKSQEAIVWVHFSGHGCQHSGETLPHFLCSDAAEVSADQILSKLIDAGQWNTIGIQYVGILDCCRKKPSSRPEHPQPKAPQSFCQRSTDKRWTPFDMTVNRDPDALFPQERFDQLILLGCGRNSTAGETSVGGGYLTRAVYTQHIFDNLGVGMFCLQSQETCLRLQVEQIRGPGGGGSITSRPEALYRGGRKLVRLAATTTSSRLSPTSASSKNAPSSSRIQIQHPYVPKDAHPQQLGGAEDAHSQPTQRGGSRHAATTRPGLPSKDAPPRKPAAPADKTGSSSATEISARTLACNRPTGLAWPAWLQELRDGFLQVFPSRSCSGNSDAVTNHEVEEVIEDGTMEPPFAPKAVGTPSEPQISCPHVVQASRTGSVTPPDPSAQATTTSTASQPPYVSEEVPGTKLVHGALELAGRLPEPFRGAEQLAKALRNHAKKQHEHEEQKIDTFKIILSEVDVQAVIEVFRELKQPLLIEEFNFRYETPAQVTREGIGIAALLKTLDGLGSSFVNVKLTCQIFTKGNAQALGDVLAAWVKLRSLDISEDKFRQDGAEVLLTAHRNLDRNPKPQFHLPVAARGWLHWDARPKEWR